MYGLMLCLHVLAASIWTGGHLVLAMTVLPRVLREKAPRELFTFESGYERIGVPALLVQAITGVWLAYRMLPDVHAWIKLDNPVARLIWVKLGLLVLTILLAADARLRILPKVTADNLASCALHIISATIVAVLFVMVGVAFRTGWFC